MRNNIFNHLLAVLAAAGTVLFSSCDKEDNSGTEDGEVQYEITGEFSYTATEMADKLFGPDGANADDELKEAFLAKVHEKEAKLEEELGANGLAFGYRGCSFNYLSTDEFGKSIVLSGLVSWGTYWLFGTHDLDPDDIYLWEHHTITANNECPSLDGSTEMAVAGDNLLIMPDYIGYGASKSRLHSYLNYDVAAINSIDALKAGYEVWKQKGSGVMEDDWHLYVIGTSQGGSNALAVHKYLDTHPQLASDWRFDYSYCSSGPYSPTITMQEYYDKGYAGFECVIPMTIKSMLYCYPAVMGKWSEEDFYSDKYLEHKAEIDKIYVDKCAGSGTINIQIRKFLGITVDDDDETHAQLTDIMSKSALDQNSEMMKAFFYCLDKNDLTKGWTPTHKMKLYASETDDVVTYKNTQAVKDAFGDKVEVFKSYWAGHVATCKKWYTTILDDWW